MITRPQRRLVAAAAAALVLAAGDAAAMCIGVRLRFADAAPSWALVDAMKLEAAAIWDPYGLRIEWQTTSRTAACGPVQASFAVSVERRRLWGASSRSVQLGRTRVAPGAIDAVPIVINQEAIERVLETLAKIDVLQLVGHPAAAAPDVGRAMGRILAHEIGHVILAAPRHQREGLMRRAFRPAELIAHERRAYDLTAADQARLQQRECELKALAGTAAACAPSLP